MSYIIAEAGACGDGDLAKMLAQIDACAEAGVDAVKFQWTSDALTMARRRGQAEAHGYAPIYRRYLQWDTEWHVHLRERCDSLSVDYLCSVYLPQDIEVIDSHVRHFKVSSFETHDRALQSQIVTRCVEGDGRRWMVISVGMCTDQEVVSLKRSHIENTFVRFLHCVSAYPTPFASMNLSRIRTSSLHGFSDHTVPALTMTGALAVAAGATIIEAHMRLDETDPLNPDAAHAMTPAQLTDYVQQIRMTEKAMTLTADTDSIQQPMRRYLVRGRGADTSTRND